MMLLCSQVWALTSYDAAVGSTTPNLKLTVEADNTSLLQVGVPRAVCREGCA